MDNYRSYIHASRYARFVQGEGRRETHEETIDRYIKYFQARASKKQLNEVPWEELREAILAHEIMPSMRALMTAGVALDRDAVAGYNCSYVAVDHPRVFDEILYILMCGTGVGFSVERQFINKLPEIAEEFHDTDSVIVVRDSKIGWASSFRQLVSFLYNGLIPRWDVSKVRPAGERLKTFGGRASGPEPLIDLFKFTIAIFQNARGRKLNSIECHDIVCKVADVVICGGVRRSALLSLSNLTDERMQRAKSGDWWNQEPQRALANNSVCYTEKPDIGIFMREWLSLYDSKSGERGIFNRVSCKKMAPERRDTDYEFGTNPCSEIVLRSKQFCNLTEVVCRPADTLEDLKRKTRLATILGTMQATLTDFRYLSKAWKDNTEEERLLGVSLTGIMDHKTLSNTGSATERFLREMKEVAVETNEHFAEVYGINQSAAITCVKPSGTVSQMVDSASGIHPRYSEYYIRTVRQDKKDPMANWMIEKGFPVEEDVMFQNNWVFSFPQKAPTNSVFRDDMTAIQQLKHWKMFAENWCEHKPSITVYVREHEWMAVGAWVYRNFDICNGVSFLPHTDHSYRQAPYQECTEIEYQALKEKMPKDVDYSSFVELEDNTIGSQELACAAGGCEI